MESSEPLMDIKAQVWQSYGPDNIIYTNNRYDVLITSIQIYIACYDINLYNLVMK